MIVNIGNNSGTVGYVLSIYTSVGATVTAMKNGKSYTTTSDNLGMAIFKKLTKGIWTVTAEKNGLATTATVDMQEDKSITIVLDSVPDFTYNISAADGGYKIYNDNGVDITNNPEIQGNWKIEFLKSGILTINRLNGAIDGIDVFCVGGGGRGGYGYSGDGGSGGGGGGGFTTTKTISVEATSYEITIGGSGGASKFGNLVSANPGSAGADGTKGDGIYADGKGGNGGSGGGAGRSNTGGLTSPGGTDGNDGTSWTASGKTVNGGKGQRSLGAGTTTREFGEPTGKLYAAGGAGGTCYEGANNTGLSSGAANTGNGGAGAGYNSVSTSRIAYGGSGIVIIRNKR